MPTCRVTPAGGQHREVSSLTSTAASAIQKQERPVPRQAPEGGPNAVGHAGRASDTHHWEPVVGEGRWALTQISHQEVFKEEAHTIECSVFPAEGSPVPPGAALVDIWAPICLAAEASHGLPGQRRGLVPPESPWAERCTCLNMFRDQELWALL